MALARLDASAPLEHLRSALTASQLSGLAAVAVGAGAVSVRLPGVLRDSFWQDEVAAARVLVEPTPVSLVRHIARTEATPPLWYSLGWAAHRIGVSPEGYRGLSVLAGGLLAASLLILARRVLPLWASIVAGLFVAFGWSFVAHGRELRAYELLALLTTLFALALVSAAATPGRPQHRGALVLSVALGSLTNYFFLLSLVGGLVWVWLEPTLRPVRRRLTALIVCGLAPLLVWSPVAVHQYRAGRFTWIGAFDLHQAIQGYWLVFAQHLPAGGEAQLLLPLLLLGAVVLGAIVLWSTSSVGRLIALLALSPFVLETLAWRAGAHVFHPRNLIGAAPFAAVALAALFPRLRSPRGGAAALVAVAVVAGATIAAERTATAPYDRTAEALVAQGWQAGDPVEVLGRFFAFRSPLEWYLPGRPALTLAEPASGSCRAIFVVAEGPANRRHLLASRLLGARVDLGTIVVGTLRVHRPPTAPLWRRANLLATTGTGAPCAVPLSEQQIVSHLHR